MTDGDGDDDYDGAEEEGVGKLVTAERIKWVRELRN